MKLFSVVFPTILGIALFACASSKPSDSGGTGTGRTGVTTCGGVQCQAGQYCENISCVNGCLSDNNCAGNQACVKSATSSSTVGSCMNAMTTTNTSCTDLCKKAIACGVTQTQTQCENACIGLSEACKSCTIMLGCNAPRSSCPACN
jgi:hypothetical protein